LTPRDLINTHLENPTYLHFICSPKRAKEILSEIDEIDGWTPRCIFEPIPDRCVPEELPALQEIIHRIYILSPNAEEALSLLSMRVPPTKVEIERAADVLLSFGARTIIIRSGALGAYVKVSGKETGTWIPAFFSGADSARVVDVTGAGNAFLGGLVAGLSLTNDDVVSASLYATLSAAYTVEQKGLPKLTQDDSIELWNNDRPSDRLQQLKSRLSHDTDVL